MQADFVLFLRAGAGAAKNIMRQWWPETLLYAGRHSGPFEIFARSQSAQYFEKIKALIGVTSKVEFLELLSKFSPNQNADLYLPRWEFNRLEVKELAGADKIGSRP